MKIEEIESQLETLISSYPEPVIKTLSGFGYNGEVTPRAMVVAHKAFPEKFALALDTAVGEFLGADGKKKKDVFGNILDTALAVIEGTKAFRDRAQGNPPAPTPEPVEITPTDTIRPTNKILGLPRGIFAMAVLVVVLILVFVGIKVFAKK